MNKIFSCANLILQLPILLLFIRPLLADNLQTGFEENRVTYGTRVATESLNNLMVGRNYQASYAYRFRAQESGILSGIRVYWIYKYCNSGKQWNRCEKNGKKAYHDGDGGFVRVSVRPDDESPFHLPSDRQLASTDIAMKLCTPKQVKMAVGRDSGPCGMQGKLNTEGKRMTFKRIGFSNAPALKKGVIYHIVFENLAADPESNWVSLNGMFHPNGLKTLLGGLKSVNDLVALVRLDREDWQIRNDTMPIISLIINGGESKESSGGKEFGFGYVAAWTSNKLPSISKSVYARQVFSPSISRTFSAVNVYVGLISGTGNMLVDLRSSDNRTLRTVKIPSSELPGLKDCPWGEWLGSNPEPKTSCGVWVRRTFQPLSVEAGKSYWIVIRSQGEVKFGVNLLQKGLFYNFGKDTVFREGYSDMSYNAGSTWQPWVVWEQKRADADLQFFLEQ